MVSIEILRTVDLNWVILPRWALNLPLHLTWILHLTWDISWRCQNRLILERNMRRRLKRTWGDNCSLLDYCTSVDWVCLLEMSNPFILSENDKLLTVSNIFDRPRLNIRMTLILNLTLTFMGKGHFLLLNAWVLYNSSEIIALLLMNSTLSFKSLMNWLVLWLDHGYWSTWDPLTSIYYAAVLNNLNWLTLNLDRMTFFH